MRQWLCKSKSGRKRCRRACRGKSTITAQQMREKIDESVIQSGAKTLVLDFSLVTFMDSSGIGLVMGRFRLMQENGGELVLQNLPAPLRKVMKLAGLDKLAKFQ